MIVTIAQIHEGFLAMKLFFNYSIDCETPPNTEYTGRERRAFFGGPPTWEFAETSVRGFVERMEGLGVLRGASLFVYPDVATHQRSLYLELAGAGIEVALHLNGLRYSRLRGNRAKWLGEMSCGEQREALRMGKQDLEDVVGKPCLGYRACYGSANDDTFPMCEELDFTWASNASGRNRPDFFANWAGSCPHPHHTNRTCKLVPGDMKLYEIPVTSGLKTFHEGNPNQPLDLRAETPPSVIGEKREIYRNVILENIIEMQQQNAPVRAITVASHNTNPYGDQSTYQSQNLAWVVEHTRQLAREHALEFTPARFVEIKAEADRVGAC